MKKTTAVLSILAVMIIAAMIMTGCGKTAGTVENSEDKVSGDLEYNIERIDSSMTSEIEPDQFSMTQYYDLVTLEDENDVASAINKELNKDYEDFKSVFTETQGYFDDLEENLKNGGDLPYEGPVEYIHTVETRVSQNDEKVFSVVYSSEWYMGGVFNANTDGAVFLSSTGEKLTLDKYLGVSEEQAMKYVLNTVAREISLSPDQFDDESYKTVEKMSVDDIDFYVEKDKVYICFDTYEIACGASGSFVFELITETVEDEETEADEDSESYNDKWYFSLESDEQTSLGIGIGDTKEYVYSKVGSDISYETDVIYDEEIMDGPFESFKVGLKDGTCLYFQKQCEESDTFYLCGISTTNNKVKFGRNIYVGLTENEIKAKVPDFSEDGDSCYAADVEYSIDNDDVNCALKNGSEVFFGAWKNDGTIYFDCGVDESDWSINFMEIIFDGNKVSKIRLSDGYVTYPDFD